MSQITFALIKTQTRLKQMFTVCNAIVRNKISFYPPFVEEFEKRFANYIGREYGLTFCNGTSSIEAAMFAANIGEGDEVIVPSCTFHASIDPILNIGATPVFADVDPQSLTISPVDVEKKITSKTKAIVVVHLFGIPANMDALLQVLKDRQITLIEDVSHAHGARWGDKLCGSIGDFGAFSLQGRKSVAAGEGGIVVTDDFSAYIRMSMWGHFNRHSEHFSSINADEFRFTGVGHKRRIAPISALLADADLDHLEKLNKIKQNNTKILDQELGNIPGIAVAKPATKAIRGGFFQGYPIIISKETITADPVLNLLNSAGITAISYPFALHHKLPVYTDQKFRHSLMKQQVKTPQESNIVLPITENLQKQMLLLSPQYFISLNKNTLNKMKNIFKSL
jgi:perosamine synthetase